MAGAGAHGGGGWRWRSDVARAWEDVDVALGILLFCDVGRNAGRASGGRAWGRFGVLFFLLTTWGEGASRFQ